MATYTSSLPAALVQLLSWLSLLHLSLERVIGSQYPTNPSKGYLTYLSTGLTISDYIGEEWSNFTICNNESSSFLFVNEQGNGLYGISTDLYSDHYYESSYSVYFILYFVTAAENICLKDSGNNNISAYYLSLVAWDRNDNNGQVIWTANPHKPVTRNACLHLNDSDLSLVDYHDNIGSSPEVVWQTSTTSVRNASLIISFEGNLVLAGTINGRPYMQTVWESFRYPTNTLMVLQVLQNTSVLAVNSTATTNSGNYTLAFHNGHVVLYAKIGQRYDAEQSPYGSRYWVWPDSSVPINDNISFVVFCWDSVNQLRLYAGSNRLSGNSTVSPEFCSKISNNSGTVIQFTGLHPSINATYATFLRLESDGDLRAYTVDNTTITYSPTSDATWRAFYNIFNTTPCDLPLYCGFHGMCDPQGRGLDGSHHCSCDYGGKEFPELGFVDAPDPKSGCEFQNSGVAQLWDLQNIPREASTCRGNVQACASNVSECEIEFLPVHDVHYFSLEVGKRFIDVNGCKEECKSDSCCAAAFWNKTSGECFVVLGRLGTIKKHGTMQAFIKYVRIRNIPSHGFPWKIVVGPVLVAALFVACILLVYWRSRTRKLSKLQREHLLLLSLLDCSNTERFTWKQMHEYTCGFSDFLGGGGFGRVFRGALPDGTAIAVKQLDEERSHGQGDKEFIAEVSILSRIHHAHLVRLIGFCLEDMHRLLVYEYMENGSLDEWLFKSRSDLDVNEKDNGQELLPWTTRHQIALGTAKGLAYLHEECEERVIHMDLKPQNILLGRSFLPKISDFGMSRRTAREQTSVMTVMRGTPGYLAPEWLLDCAITEKCDVYSFGIVLLELVSGRKLKDLTAVKQKLSMRSLRESVMLDFVDERLRYGSYGSDVEEKEAVRMVEVALLCVRTDPTKRPPMSSVVLMLEGKEEVLQEFKGAEEQEELLFMYPSPMNRTMRMDQVQEGMFDMYSSFGSSRDSESGSFSKKKKKFMKGDRGRSQSEAKSASLFETERSSSLSLSTEWDRLLQD